jgi:hypothetical protein
MQYNVHRASLSTTNQIMYIGIILLFLAHPLGFVLFSILYFLSDSILICCLNAYGS